MNSESETKTGKARGRETKGSSRFPDQLNECTTQDRERKGQLEWSPDNEVSSAKLCLQDLMEKHTDKNLGHKERMSLKTPTEGTVACHDNRSCRNGVTGLRKSIDIQERKSSKDKKQNPDRHDHLVVMGESDNAPGETPVGKP